MLMALSYDRYKGVVSLVSIASGQLQLGNKSNLTYVIH